MKKMLFTLSNILFLGLPYLMVRMMGGLTPDERDATLDKVRNYQVSLKLQPFADEGDFHRSMSILFYDHGDLKKATQFLVDLQRRYHFSASDRQLEVVESLPDRTFEVFVEVNGLTEVEFDGRRYNSHDHVFCHNCRTPMMKVNPWHGDNRCGNCAGTKVTDLYGLDEREYLDLLREFEKGPAPSQPAKKAAINSFVDEDVFDF